MGTRGHLSGGLSNPYFFNATSYRLFAPIALSRQFEDLLTLVDLNLDRRLDSVHKLAKVLYVSFNSADDAGLFEPALDYEPLERKKSW